MDDVQLIDRGEVLGLFFVVVLCFLAKKRNMDY